jgi:hypothetical protein
MTIFKAPTPAHESMSQRLSRDPYGYAAYQAREVGMDVVEPSGLPARPAPRPVQEKTMGMAVPATAKPVQDNRSRILTPHQRKMF